MLKYYFKILPILFVFSNIHINYAQICRLDTLYKYEYDVPNSIKNVISRTVNTYNTSDVLIEYLIQNWNQTKKEWVNDQKSIFNFNTNKLLQDRYSYKWDTTSKKWINFISYTYTYDLNKNNLSNTYLSWDISLNKWIGINKNLYVFDKNNNRLEYYNQTFNKTTSAWVNQNKQEHKFDSLNREIEYTTYKWDKTGNKWIGEVKKLHTYNVDSQIKYTLIQSYLPLALYWVNSSQEFYIFNKLKKLENVYIMSYLLSENRWKPYRKQLYTYDTFKRNIKIETYTNDTFIGVDTVYLNKTEYLSYDSFGNNIESYQRFKKFNPFSVGNPNDIKINYTFNKSNITTQFAFYNWDTLSKNWIPNYKYNWVYKNDTLPLQFSTDMWNLSGKWIRQFENNYTLDSQNRTIALDKYTKWDTLLNKFNGHTREEYKCKKVPIINATKNASSLGFSIYPNPTSDFIIINNYNQAKMVKLYGLNGKLELSILMQKGKSKIDLSHLKPSLYILKIDTNYIKLVKQN